MNPFDIRALESPLKPVLDPRVYVEPKDRGPASELDRQGAWVSFMHRHARRVLVYAVRNGAHIASTAGRNKAKREGLYTGFPDTGANWDGGLAYLEWKDARGDPGDAQIECLNRLTAMGYPCAIVRTMEAANRWLIQHGAPIPVRDGVL
jgi:hypothetical protein